MNILIIRNIPSHMDVKYNTYNIQEVGLAKAFVRKGHRCDIVFWTDQEEVDYKLEFENKYSVMVFYRNGKCFMKNAYYNNIGELIAKYDIIQTCEYNQFESWNYAGKYPQKTVIYHGPYFSKFNKRYNLMCKVTDLFMLSRYKKKNSIFLVKSNLAKRFLIKKGIQEVNITVTGVGIDLDALTLKESEELPLFIQKLDDLSNCIKLLYIGCWEPRRNITFLFDVLKRINDSGKKAKLICIGTGKKDYVKNCWEYANKIGVNDCIIKTDAMEQRFLAEIYKRAEVFLLPTHYEIFGMVLLEAMYYGVPVVTTQNGGSVELIDDNINGFIRNLDYKHWAETILMLLNNKEATSKLIDNATKTIKENYTWDKVCEAMIAVYERKNKQ